MGYDSYHGVTYITPNTLQLHVGHVHACIIRTYMHVYMYVNSRKFGTHKHKHLIDVHLIVLCLPDNECLIFYLKKFKNP